MYRNKTYKIPVAYLILSKSSQRTWYTNYYSPYQETRARPHTHEVYSP